MVFSKISGSDLYGETGKTSHSTKSNFAKGETPKLTLKAAEARSLTRGGIGPQENFGRAKRLTSSCLTPTILLGVTARRWELLPEKKNTGGDQLTTSGIQLTD